METATKQILDKLDEIKSEICNLKSRLIDVDILLTDDDTESLHQAELDLKEKKTVKL